MGGSTDWIDRWVWTSAKVFDFCATYYLQCTAAYVVKRGGGGVKEEIRLTNVWKVGRA